MQIYNYHSVTKEYLGESTADKSPLEEDIYLIPANATEIKPPEVSENQVAVFKDENWTIAADFRGNTYYDKDTGQPVIIDFIGNIPDNLQDTLPLNVLKQQKISEIQNAYTNSFLNGLESAIGIKFHIKPDDQLNYIGAMIATASLQDSDTLPFPLIDFYGAMHQITVGQSRQAYIEIVGYKAQMELKRATLLGQINNVTIENIEEIVWQS